MWLGNIVAPLPGRERSVSATCPVQRSVICTQAAQARSTHPAFRLLHSIERKLTPCRGAQAGADRPAGAVVVVDWWCRASTRKSKPVMVEGQGDPCVGAAVHTPAGGFSPALQ